MTGQFPANRRLVAIEEKGQVRPALQRQRRTANGYRRAVIAAHGIERNGLWVGHLAFRWVGTAAFMAGRA